MLTNIAIRNFKRFESVEVEHDFRAISERH